MRTVEYLMLVFLTASLVTFGIYPQFQALQDLSEWLVRITGLIGG